MIDTKIYTADNKLSKTEKQEVVDFLYVNLQEYGDQKNEIQMAIDFATEDVKSFGGFVMTLEEDEKIKAAVVINRTGMGGYIPENILVYIATHKGHRGEGLGKKLMKETIEHTDGDIALHVEANNPAIKLYEKFGFTNPYLEMRLKK